MPAGNLAFLGQLCSQKPHTDSHSSFTLAPNPNFRPSLTPSLPAQPAWAGFQLRSVQLPSRLFCAPERPSLAARTSPSLTSSCCRFERRKPRLREGIRAGEGKPRGSQLQADPGAHSKMLAPHPSQGGWGRAQESVCLQLPEPQTRTVGGARLAACRHPASLPQGARPGALSLRAEVPLSVLLVPGS